MYTILLVDDEPILLRAAKGFLEKYSGFRCETCTSGPEALDRIQAASYDAVVSDFEMPGMNGIDLLKAIRETLPDLPFILFTGRGREEVAIEALNSGADFYVQKGGDIEAQFADLSHKIRHAAEKAQSARQLRDLNRALEGEKERLRVTLRSIGDGVIVTDTEGVVVSLNRVAEELCGWKSKAAAGHPLTDVFHIINEKTGAVCTNPVQKVLENGHIVGLANHTALISRDGTRRAIADSAAPIRDAGDAVIGVVLVFRDVTAEKEAERTHLRLAAVAGSSVDAIYTVTPEGIIATWNRGAEQIYGYTAEEVVGRHVSVVAPPDLGHESTELMAQVKEGNPVEQYETYRYRKGGKKIHITLAVSPLVDAEGDFLGFSGISRDITERKRYEQRIEHLNRVLLSIRNMNQIIVEETDTPRLLQRICDSLTESGGYHHAWIALCDDTGRLAVRAGSGLEERLHALNDQFCGGRIAGCARKALDSPLSIITRDPASSCTDCPLVPMYEGRGAMTIRIEHGDTVYGLISLSMPRALIDDEEELNLFEEVAADIGIALHGIGLEQERAAAVRALAEEKERLRVTLRSIGDGVIVTDTEGLVVFLNPVAEELCGWKSREAAGHPLTDVFHIINEKTRRVCTNPVQKVLESGHIVGLANHTALISRNGEERIIADSAAPIHDAGDAVIGVVLVFRDVTAEKRAEMERLRLTAIAESSENAIFNASPDGIILGWNAGAERMTGYAAAEIIGSHISTLAPPGRKKESRKNVARMRNDRRVLQLETVRARKDGSLIDIAATILPLLDEDGDYVGFSGIIRDITGKKEAEKRMEHINRVLLAIRNVNQLITQVRDEETLLKKVCDTLIETRGFYSAWIALFDEAGTFTRAVEAGLGGGFLPMAERLSRGELTRCGRRALENPGVIVTKNPASSCRDCPVASRSCGRAAMTRRLEWEDRVYGLLSLSIPPEMADDEEEQALFEEVASDIGFALHTYEIDRDRTRAEEALFEANTKLNLLSSITRHDLINQTTGISAMMLLLAEELEGNPAAQEYFEYVQEALDTINRQISFTRDYENMGVNRPEWQQVAAVIERAAETTLANGISLENQTGSLEIYADPMVERVFFNLLDNAVRHGSQVSVIRVLSATEDGQCRITVEDDGDGIPASEKETIFERGFGKNTGYGLFLARAILDITGISIRETGEEGKGARFEIEVPDGQWRAA